MKQYFFPVLTFFILLSIGVVALGSKTFADASEWESYFSETGLFNMRFFDEYEKKFETFRITPMRVLVHEEISGVIDQRPYRNEVKHALAKFDQTIGPALTPEEQKKLIENELLAYEKHYSKFDGQVIDKSIYTISTLPVGDITISFTNQKKNEKSYVRIRVTTNSYSKMQQIASGTSSFVNSLETDSYFDSLRMVGGTIKEEGDPVGDWDILTSPLQIFTMMHPKVQKPFISMKPQIKSTEDREVVLLQLFDPLRKEKVYYNTYGYFSDKSLSFSDVEDIIRARHIARYVLDPRKIDFKRFYDKDYPVLETTLYIPKQNNMPFVETLNLRVKFDRNFINVREILSSEALLTSDLITTLTAFTEFHPDKARERLLDLMQPENKISPSSQKQDSQNEVPLSDLQNGENTGDTSAFEEDQPVDNDGADNGAPLDNEASDAKFKDAASEPDMIDVETQKNTESQDELSLPESNLGIILREDLKNLDNGPNTTSPN